MENNANNPKSIDPYAPPKTVANNSGIVSYLEHDGYSFENELVSNKHFRSPHICAKLGIDIDDKSIEPVPVTVIRIPIFSKVFHMLITLSIFGLAILLFNFTKLNAFVIPILLVIHFTLKRILTKPYQIPFYFSEQYLALRKRRKILFSVAFILLFLTFIYGARTNEAEISGLCFVGMIITYIVLKFKMTQFVVTLSNSEFHYIRGVHKNLLAALPELPNTSKNDSR